MRWMISTLIMECTSKKRSLYHIHIELTREYEPAQKKNKPKQYTYLDLENMRVQDKKHLDIWCDGKIYPKNPINNTTPCFSTPSSLLRYASDGHKGLLGYCNALSSHANSLRYLYNILSNEISMFKAQNYKLTLELQVKDQSICNLERKVKDLRKKKTKLGERERERKVKNVETLKCGSGGLKRRIRAAR